MKIYQLITYREWQNLQQDVPPSLLAKNHGFFEFKKTLLEASGFKAVNYQYRGEMDEIIQFIVRHQDSCQNLYEALDKLGLYYGRNTYNHDDVKFSAVLKTALTSERAILISKEVEYDSGMLPPQTNFLKLPNNKIPRKLTSEEVKARERALHQHDEENWIELTFKDNPGQDFSLFHSASQQFLYQGTLDDNGHAYVKLEPRINHVDVVFDKQDEHRPWYQDVPLQIAGGIRDAAQSTLDLAWDVSSWLPSSPLFLSRIYQAIISDKPVITADNPVNIYQIPQAETVAGALTHGVTQFLVGFIPLYRAMKFVKPLQKMGSWGKGIIAGGAADFTVFAPHEERLSNLIESFPELSNPITCYLQAKPDDSAAEGRLKNALEGLLIGAVSEPFIHALRTLKYARIKWMAIEVKTKVHYTLEVVTIETESGGKGNWNKILNNPKPNIIYKVDGNKVFYTDELGRIKQVDAELKLNPQDRNNYQQLKTGLEGIEGDEGGHLIASILDGSGEKINLLPMNANLNRGAWKQMENTWATALQEGKTVKVKIEPIYSGTGARPDKFKVNYSIDNGRNIEKMLINAPGGM